MPKEQNDFGKEILIRSIKILDISYITVLYFLFGSGAGMWLDGALSRWVFTTQATTAGALTFEIVIQVMFVGILTYIFRNIVELIPFPFHGVAGFDHFRVKELKSGALFTVFAVMFSYNFQDKVTRLRQVMTAQAPAREKLNEKQQDISGVWRADNEKN